ncbi:MAG: OB-fold nucleic acid binding domain-containing protein, partial [Patescibacteria group bacterium]
LDELGERGQLLHNLEMLLECIRQNKKNEDSPQIGLFDSGEIKTGPLRLQPAEPTTSRQKLLWEKELLGLYISDHPLAEHKEVLEKHATAIRDITDNAVGRTIKLGGMVSGIKKIITKKGAPMLFANLQDLKDKIELVVFPETLEKTREMWQEDNIILVSGKVDMRDGAYKLICNTAKKI